MTPSVWMQDQLRQLKKLTDRTRTGNLAMRWTLLQGGMLLLLANRRGFLARRMRSGAGFP
jgi:hypothetical protein